jgi:hypothetical protein
MNPIQAYLRCLIDPKFAKPAFKVAIVIGTLLFAINHGSAVLHGKMNRDRWISALLTYIVPYCVNIHGQFISRSQRN